MEKKIAICIGRQIGSGGGEIARKISEELGIPMFDKEIMAVAARSSGFEKELFENVDEKASQSVFGWFLGSSLMFNDSMIVQDSLVSNDSLFKMQYDAIHQIVSKQSALFVGRCADFILRDHPGCLSIFISGDNDDRIKRVSRLQKISMEDATKMVRKTDKQRAAYYKYYTDKIWGAAPSYHFCVNSSVLGISGTAEALLCLVKRRFG